MSGFPAWFMRYLPNRVRRGVETVADLGCGVAGKHI